MSLRGKAAIVGVGETPHRRVWPGRSMFGLCAEAAAQAIEDAGLRREDIDGLMTYGGPVYPGPMAEYIGIRPTHFGVGAGFMGGSSGCALSIAANVVANGMANNVMFVAGGARDPGNPDASIYMGGPGAAPPSMGSEFVSPYGPVIAANTTYGLLYTRHMYEYGTTQEQLARISVNQRFNALKNPLAAFRDQPITVEDVLNSRYVNYPLHLLECVMPVAGAIAFIISSAERARVLRQPPVYILGVGVHQGYANSWLNPDILESPVKISAASAYQMAGYGVKDIQFAEFYDWYTILEAVCLEDAGICKKGEIGPFFESTDTTYQGTFPINTDGGQLSAGQLNPAGASGTQQIVESTRQIRGQAGERQLARHDLALANTWGGGPSQMATMVLGSAATL